MYFISMATFLMKKKHRLGHGRTPQLQEGHACIFFMIRGWYEDKHLLILRGMLERLEYLHTGISAGSMLFKDFKK